MVNEYKLTAPNIDFLLDKFEDSSMRPSMPSKELTSAMDRLFDVLHDLAPSKERSEEKSIWIRIPRGTIENYASYDDMVKKELQQQKEQTDNDLSAYLKKQDPVFTESRNGMLEAGLSGNRLLV